MPIATAGTFLILAVFSVVRDDFAFVEPFAAMLVPMFLVYLLAPRANSILALCTVFVRMILVGFILTFVYRIEGFFTAETRVEILYEIIGYAGAIFVYWKFLREGEKEELRGRQAANKNWLADKTAPRGRIEKLVHDAIRDDGFIVKNLEERREDDVVAIISLVPAYQTINSWRNMRTLKSFVETTNVDVIAFELGTFGLYRALMDVGAEIDAIIQKMKNSGLSDEDIEVEFYEAEEHGTPLLDDPTGTLNGAVIMLRKIFRLEYELENDEVQSLWGSRVQEYGGPESTAHENLALHLARSSGAKNFQEKLDPDKIDGKTHVAMMLEVASYRRRVIPALLESVKNLNSVS